MIITVRNIDFIPKNFVLLAAALLVSPWFGSAADAAQNFDKVLKFDGIIFQVTCANEGSLNDLTITPDGLEIDNSAMHKKDIDGIVTGADVADINEDGSPEIYVYITSAGSGSYGSLVAYGANRKKSLSEIYLPPLEDDKINSRGYMGHDTFSIRGNRLVRSFPIYKDGDSNAQPTGGTRTLEYKLISGEATWQLVLVKSSNQSS